MMDDLIKHTLASQLIETRHLTPPAYSASGCHHKIGI